MIAVYKYHRHFSYDLHIDQKCVHLYRTAPTRWWVADLVRGAELMKSIKWIFFNKFWKQVKYGLIESIFLRNLSCITLIFEISKNYLYTAITIWVNIAQTRQKTFLTPCMYEWILYCKVKLMSLKIIHVCFFIFLFLVYIVN